MSFYVCYKTLMTTHPISVYVYVYWAPVTVSHHIDWVRQVRFTYTMLSIALVQWHTACYDRYRQRSHCTDCGASLAQLNYVMTPLNSGHLHNNGHSLPSWLNFHLYCTLMTLLLLCSMDTFSGSNYSTDQIQGFVLNMRMCSKLTFETELERVQNKT